MPAKARWRSCSTSSGGGSRWLSELRPGDPVDTLGPLGSSFAPPDECRHLLLVGGGIGLGPLIAQAAIETDRSCVILNGARSQAGLTPAAKLPAHAEAYYATDDGSFGAKGSVVELLPEWYQWSDAVLACGPNPMLQACASRIDALDPAPRRVRRRPVQFALEARMACGLGVCYSCVVTTRTGLKRVCTEGPVFGAWDLTWQWGFGHLSQPRLFAVPGDRFDSRWISGTGRLSPAVRHSLLSQSIPQQRHQPPIPDRVETLRRPDICGPATFAG